MPSDPSWALGLERAAEALRLGQRLGATGFHLLRAVACAGRVVPDFPAHEPDAHANAIVRAAYLAMRDDPRWVVLYVPSGALLASHPLSDTLVLGPGVASPRAGHWTLAVVDRDGRRAGPVRLKSAPADLDPAFGRAATLALGRLLHAGAVPPETWERQRRAEAELVEGRPALLREAELERPPPGPGEEAADDLFGAAWDLGELVLSTPAPPAAAGAWRLPDEPNRVLLTRVAVLRSLTDLVLVPAFADLGCLSRRLRSWLVAARGAADRGVANDLLHLLTAAHESYWNESAAALSVHLGEKAVGATLRAGRVGGWPVPLPGARGMVDRLLAEGRADWAAMLWAGMSAEVPPADEVALVRRLRGFRLATGRPLADAATALHLTTTEARKLLARHGVPYTMPIDGSEVWRAAYSAGEIGLGVFGTIDALSRPGRTARLRTSRHEIAPTPVTPHPAQKNDSAQEGSE